MMRLRNARQMIVGVALLAGAVQCVGVTAATPDPGFADSPVLGLVGKDEVHESDLVRGDSDAFERLKNSRDQVIRQAQMQFAQASHDLLAHDLDKVLDRRAVELEATQRHTTPEALSSQIKVPVVTENEVRAFYESHKDRTDQPFEALADSIKQYLAKQHDDAASREFYDQLRQKHGIRSLLGPYRVNVAATGPSRGAANAPITILEFGDFQCPYCKHAEAVLQSLLSEHGSSMRIVFRNLPLTTLHPDAQLAAEAAVCAQRQDKFWEMHDAMFDHQDQLNVTALTDTAARLGLDRNGFAQCLGDKGADSAIQADVKAARDVGVSSTPYFFINGRPLLGEPPKDEFERMINEELRALGKQSS